MHRGRKFVYLEVAPRSDFLVTPDGKGRLVPILAGRRDCWSIRSVRGAEFVEALRTR